MSKDLQHSTARSERRAKIRALNDAFRTTFVGGRVMMTVGIAALTNGLRTQVLQKVREFDAFDDANDPWDEHDFVSIEVDRQTVFAKIDYYDLGMRYRSDDPSDGEKTCRIMTIMLAEEH